jgi:PEP-CTERM motif
MKIAPKRYVLKRAFNWGMQKMSKMLKILCAAAALAAPQVASAAVTVGGFTFDDNAFVDVLLNSSGNYTTQTGGSVASVLTDTDVNTWAFSFDTGAFVDLGFTDNVAINGTGNDIVLFELGVADRWLVTINGISNQCQSVASGAVNACAFDLSTFGIANGGSISSLRLSFFNDGTTATTSLVGALNSGPVGGGIPEPASWAMLMTGFGLVGAAMRRRAATAAV